MPYHRPADFDRRVQSSSLLYQATYDEAALQGEQDILHDPDDDIA